MPYKQNLTQLPARPARVGTRTSPRPFPWLLGLIVLLAAATTAIAQPAAPVLTTDSAVATAGFFKLSWEHPHASDFELQLASTPDFAIASGVYHGPDLASSFSGYADGTYYYRVRGTDPITPWSDAVSVTVEHHPLARAWLFFGLGALVFVATLLLILSAPRENRTA